MQFDFHRVRLEHFGQDPWKVCEIGGLGGRLWGQFVWRSRERQVFCLCRESEEAAGSGEEIGLRIDNRENEDLLTRWNRIQGLGNLRCVRNPGFRNIGSQPFRRWQSSEANNVECDCREVRDDLVGFAIILTQLQTGVNRLDLTPPIPVVDDTDPLTVFDIDVTTINDTSAADRDCIVFGVRMASDSGGNINLATTNFIPAGGQSLVMMSNFWLLARVTRPLVASALGLSVSDFDTPLRLNRNVPAPGGQGTLTRLEARIDGNRIRVDGRAVASGTGWSAESNFFFFIDITLSGGAITITATSPSVSTDVDLEWWVWLVSLGLGALFGGVIGVIVGAVALAIVQSVAEGMVNTLVSGGISGALGGIPSIPLGPIGSGLTLDSVILDDLELRCAITRSLGVPVKTQGSHV